MDLDAQQALQGRLGASEQLLWSGRPRQGLLLRRADVFNIPFSILWCGFAVFWTISAHGNGAPLAFLFPGFLFVAIGLYFVFGRFFYDAQVRARTYYGLSSERILILGGMLNRELKSLNVRTLSDVSLVERSDGRGTITFGPTGPWDSWGSGSSWPGMGSNSPRFDCIDNAKQVYDLVRDAQKRA